MIGRGRDATKVLVSVDDYEGEAEAVISATQLGSEYSAHRARKIVDGWCEFFAAGPTPIKNLIFTSRTPKRLFASLAGQTQLASLTVKWGDYDNLQPLASMDGLVELALGGASVVSTLEPLAHLKQLRHLKVESLQHVRDLSPLGSLTNLQSLTVGGDGLSIRVTHVDSIDFLRGLPNLERLVLHTLIVDDHDYSPLLAHTQLHELRVMPTRGMRPTHPELCEVIPALQPLPR